MTTSIFRAVLMEIEFNVVKNYLVIYSVDKDHIKTVWKRWKPNAKKTIDIYQGNKLIKQAKNY